MTLRNQIIRLAYEKPQLRGVLLPLLKVAEEEAAPSSGGGGGVSPAFAQFLKEEGDKKVKNDNTGNMVKIKSLKGEKGKKHPTVQKKFESGIKPTIKNIADLKVCRNNSVRC